MQLHMHRRHIEASIRHAREELQAVYFRLFLEYYMDLESDPRVSSVSTVKLSLDKLRVILRWLQDNGIQPADIDEQTIKKLILYLKLERRLRPSSLHYYIKILRRLLKILGKEQLVSKTPYPPQTLKPYELPPPSLIEKMIAEAHSLKLQTMLALLYETGMRVSEMLSLKGKHVAEAPQGYYKLIIEEPKNKEFRTVYVIRYAGILRQYLNITKPGAEDYLFPSPIYRDKPLNPRNVEHTLKAMGEKHGVKLHPHLLRHLRATLLVKQGLPERIIMKLMGHKTEKMMKIYVNLAQKDVEEAILSHYGIPLNNNKEEAVKCPRCGARNPPGANYCWRCGTPLTTAAAHIQEQQARKIEQLARKIAEILREKPELLQQL